MRRWLAPEVVQTSSLDCGPAALKSLLEGFGITAGYDRLREACQTDLDGTSIDTMEEVARGLGLAAEQVMVPVEHLARDPTLLPAIVVVRLPQDLTHFVLVWRKVGPYFQVMDPAVGRRWVHVRDFAADVYVHRLATSGEAWREWAAEGAAARLLASRLAGAGLRGAAQRVAEAARSTDWKTLATLDAAARLTEGLVAAGAVGRGEEAERLVDALLGSSSLIPGRYWNARPIADADPEADARIGGAVLVRVARSTKSPAAGDGPGKGVAEAVGERPAAPFAHLFGHLRREPPLTFALLAAACLAVAVGVVAEPLLLRTAMDFRGHLTTVDQRVRAVVLFALFGLTVLLLEHRVLSEALRLGRLVEARFRVSWLQRLGALPERYFRSRLVSDMAERSHATHHVHDYPFLCGRFVQAIATLALVSAGIAAVEPGSAGLVVAAALATVALALAFGPAVQRHDVKVRTHSGALARFYLDALRGLTAIRAHGAERAVRSEHESLLVEWHRAGRAHARSLLAFETLQSLAGFAFALWITQRALAGGHAPAAVLLVAYWAFTYPRLGLEMAALVKQRGEQRTVALRLIEPLVSAGGDGGQAERGALTPAADARGATVRLRGVSVRAGGHAVLHDVDLEVLPGEHVAIVGASGAGKSALVGLLLGGHQASAGEVEVDDRPLTEESLRTLRGQTAWVDPAVQLWNGSLEHNILYGAPAPDAAVLAEALKTASLHGLVERLAGLQAPLGEGGGLVSGGEGQRIRFARGLTRTSVRLAVLDEAFRGLEREARRRMLERARAQWRSATLLCVTHDLVDAMAFDRVVVMAAGTIVESGRPQALAARPETLFARMVADEGVAREMWCESETWRHLRLEGGEIAWEAPRAGMTANADRTVTAHLAAR